MEMNHEHHHQPAAAPQTAAGTSMRRTTHGPGVEDHSGHEGHSEHEGHTISDFKRRFWVSVVITVPILVLSNTVRSLFGVDEMAMGQFARYTLLALSSLLFAYGGWPFLKGCIREIRDRQLGMMTLITMAITTAFAYSAAITLGLQGMDFFWELATLIDIMLLGHWIEMRSVLGASNALEKLVQLLPAVAHRSQTNGELVDIPLSDLQKGDTIVIKPGEKVPADGNVVSGMSSVNEALITGESSPVSKSTGGSVIGGSINGEGALTVIVHGTGKDSFLSKVIDLVREAQQTRSRTQDIANRAAFWLTIIALSAGAITFVAWYLVLGSTLSFAIERMVTVLVISCPHALGLAVPLVVAVSTTLAARNGLLVRDRSAFESARNIQAVVFDKTGTLTLGSFGITDVVPIDHSVSIDEIVASAAAVERYSEHPIAKAIAAAGKADRSSDGFQALPGKGAQAMVDGHRIHVISPAAARELGAALRNDAIDTLTSVGKTVVVVLIDGTVSGLIALADIVRVESAEAMRLLKAAGIRTIMLTGDNANVARWVSEQIGIEEYISDVLPHQKADKIDEIRSRGLNVAMVGDGVNDAPALARADIGIAIGAGTDVAAETADIILVKSNPLDVLRLIELARKTYRKMIQNLWWATGYNAIAIPLAAGVLSGAGIILSPALGAVLMSVSTVIVAVNSRLLHLDAHLAPTSHTNV